jgi:hypothetical protein
LQETGFCFYFMTFKVTVFDVALPFFGVTVTVTLHDPAFKPLRVLPETLQNFLELATTFSDTFEVANTLIFAKVAIDLAVTGLEVVTLGLATVGAEPGVPPRVPTSSEKSFQFDQLPAPSLTRT